MATLVCWVFWTVPETGPSKCLVGRPPFPRSRRRDTEGSGLKVSVRVPLLLSCRGPASFVAWVRSSRGEVTLLLRVLEGGTGEIPRESGSWALPVTPPVLGTRETRTRGLTLGPGWGVTVAVVLITDGGSAPPGPPVGVSV